MEEFGIKIPKILWNSLSYLGEKREFSPLQIVSEWENLLKKEPEKAKEILDLVKQKEEVHKNICNKNGFGHYFPCFELGLKIDNLVIRYLKWSGMSAYSERMTGIRPSRAIELLGIIVDHFGTLVLPENLVIDLNNPEKAEAQLELYLRNLEQHKLN